MPGNGQLLNGDVIALLVGSCCCLLLLLLKDPARAAAADAAAVAMLKDVSLVDKRAHDQRPVSAGSFLTTGVRDAKHDFAGLSS